MACLLGGCHVSCARIEPRCSTMGTAEIAARGLMSPAGTSCRLLSALSVAANGGYNVATPAGRFYAAASASCSPHADRLTGASLALKGGILAGNRSVGGDRAGGCVVCRLPSSSSSSCSCCSASARALMAGDRCLSLEEAANRGAKEVRFSRQPSRSRKSGFGQRGAWGFSRTVRMAVATDAPAPTEGAKEEEGVKDGGIEGGQTRKLKPGEALGPGYTDGSNFYHDVSRRAGVLLHPTSLPGPHGAGDFGTGAFAFIDWLKSTGCSIWQILPLVPPGRKSGEDGSPYAGQDANCGNTLLISLEKLVEYGLLKESELPPAIPVERIDFEALAALKDPLIERAATRLLASDGALKEEYEAFRASPCVSGWLENAALFAAIDNSVDAEFWWEWPADLRDRDPAALAKISTDKKEFVDRFCAQQFLFEKQWNEVHRYANEAGISIMGDMPIYVGGHSADVWAHRNLFSLDPVTGVPVLVSGVPPDAFSATGQRWGSPLYDWVAMAEDNYSWWIERMRRAFELYDEYRIDHFRAFAGYWAIPAEEETAINGTWKMGPGIEFFNVVQSVLGDFKIVAEDLGVITKDVVDLRREVNAPGMAVLQFAFGGDSKNPHLPHNHETNQVVYPGTHDNDTVLGWFQKVEQWERDKACMYLYCDEKDDDIPWVFIRAALASVAQVAIIAMQDVMGLDNSARMNMPGVKSGNWGWRMGDSNVLQALSDEASMFKKLVKTYNRLPPTHPAAKEQEEEQQVLAAAEEKDTVLEADTLSPTAEKSTV